MKLVSDWRDSWRWLSMQAMGWALVVQGAWQMIDADMRSSLPEWLVQALTIGLLALGIVGRLVDQSKPAPEKRGRTD